MHWSLYIILAAVLNAGWNYVYKLHAHRDGNVFLLAANYLATAVFLAAYHFVITNHVPDDLLASHTIGVILAMGVGTATVFTMMNRAFATAGPLSLVDPLWICLYSLVSVLCGLLITHEHPSPLALGGIVLYLAGAFLMSKGKA